MHKIKETKKVNEHLFRINPLIVCPSKPYSRLSFRIILAVLECYVSTAGKLSVTITFETYCSSLQISPTLGFRVRDIFSSQNDVHKHGHAARQLDLISPSEIFSKNDRSLFARLHQWILTLRLNPVAYKIDIWNSIFRWLSQARRPRRRIFERWMCRVKLLCSN